MIVIVGGATGKDGIQQSKGRSISGLTTKLHLAITPDFHIVEGYLSGGNIADISCADDLTACVDQKFRPCVFRSLIYYSVPKKLPKSILIVGSGAIGMEFACIYNAFGWKMMQSW